MTKYIFLTNDGYTVEAEGKSVKQAVRKAQANLQRVKKRLQKNEKKWNEYIKNGFFKPDEKIIAYDIFNEEGLSFNNWRSLPRIRKKRIVIRKPMIEEERVEEEMEEQRRRRRAEDRAIGW